MLPVDTGVAREVREKMRDWMQRTMPQNLPRLRTDLRALAERREAWDPEIADLKAAKG
ncbi:hypothetical protein HKCCE3408_13235 [Rhodobacterales bacterium HKCCE3408]|nr:hypothetical protein [Rhodobacterales bacterium HKCCE3408]